MKYAIIPEPWEETIEALDAAGHERVELKDAEFLVFNGQPDDFPELPESIGFVQVPFAGVDHIRLFRF